MQLNFSRTEYDILCKVADWHKTMPAQWCHDHVMHEAYAQWVVIKDGEREGGRREGGDGLPPPPPPSPTDPPPESDGDADE